MITITDIADELWRDLGTPPETQIPYISFWLRANIGKLDNLIFKNFSIDSSTQEIIDIVDLQIFGDKEKDIYKEIFKVKYYESQVNKFLYAGQFNLITQTTEGDSTIKRQTKNDLAKTMLLLQKEANDRLIYLAHLYKYNQSTPSQVTGDDFYSPIPYISHISLGGWSL